MLRRSQQNLSSLGGKAAKPDALQRLIIDLVRARPKITERELQRELEAAHDRRQVVDDIADGKIFFPKTGALKEAPISGLKDRLSRAKRKLNSR